MGKKSKRGGKARRRAKNDDRSKRVLIYKEDGQEYAQALKMLGNGRLRVACADGKERLAIIRGKLRRKAWIKPSDVLLVGIRSFEDQKCDVLHVYTLDEVRRLKREKELPASFTEPEETTTDDNSIVFDHDYGENDETNPGELLSTKTSTADGDDGSDSDEEDSGSDIDVDDI